MSRFQTQREYESVKRQTGNHSHLHSFSCHPYNDSVTAKVQTEPSQHPVLKNNVMGRREATLSHKEKLSDRTFPSGQIEYFELDLKAFISKAKKKEGRTVSASREHIQNVLNQFLSRIDQIEEENIKESDIRNIDSQLSSILALGDIDHFDSIFHLVLAKTGSSQAKPQGSMEGHDSKSIFRLKTVKRQLNDRIQQGKYLHPGNRLHSSKEGEYSLKRVVKTVKDREGHEFRVTVEKIN